MAFLLAGLAVAFTAVFGFGGLMIPACALMGFAINYAYMSPAPITIEAYPTEIRATGQACVTKTETKGVALEDLCGDTTVSNRTANE